MADSVIRLRLDSGDYDAKIGKARVGLIEMEKECRAAGKSMAEADEEQVAFVQGMGKMETNAKSLRGKIGEMTTAFIDLKAQYGRLTDEEKASPFGQAMSKSLDELRGRVQDARGQLEGINRELNGSDGALKFGDAVKLMGEKMGVSSSLFEAFSSKTVMMATGIGALAVGVKELGEAFINYNNQISQSDRTVKQMTGLTDSEVGAITDKVMALADTWGTDFNETLIAANSLAKGFGVEMKTALDLISKGLGEGANLNGEFFDTLKEYPAYFKEAGVSASDFIDIISKSNEMGIFSDKGVDTIKEGNLRIREMTKSTADALDGLGISSEEAVQKLKDGSITTFDVMKQVSEKLSEMEDTSPEVGAAIADIFGGPGEDAGLAYLRTLKDIGTETDSVKGKSAEYTSAMQDLQDQYERVNNKQRELFGVDGWETLGAKVKTFFLSQLERLYNEMEDIYNLWKKMKAAVGMDSDGGGSSSGSTGKKGTAKVTAKKAGDAAPQPSSWNNKDKYVQMDAQGKYYYTEAGADRYNKENKVGKYAPTAKTDTVKPTEKKTESPTVKTVTPTIRRTATKAKAVETVKAPEMVEGSSGVAPEALAKYQKGLQETYNTKLFGEGVDDSGLKQQIEDVQTLRDIIKEMQGNDIALDVSGLEGVFDNIMNGEDISGQAQAYVDEINGKLSDVGKGVKISVDGGLEVFNLEKLGFNDAAIQERISKLQSALAGADYGEARDAIQNQLMDAQTFQSLLQMCVNNGIDASQFESIATKLLNGEDITEMDWAAIQDAVNEQLKAMELEPIEIKFNEGKVVQTAKETTQSWNAAASAISKVGSTLKQIEDPGVKIMGIIMEGCANVALGFAKALAETPGGVWTWIAAAAAGTATMISTIASIKSVTSGSYAEGGIIPGSSWSGDRLTANVNSGELILNRAQQGNLASQMDGVGYGGGMLSLSGTLSGEDIIMAINNSLSRQGRGEMATIG